jgi:hypothetical protein
MNDQKMLSLKHLVSSVILTLIIKRICIALESGLRDLKSSDLMKNVVMYKVVHASRSKVTWVTLTFYLEHKVLKP